MQNKFVKNAQFDLKLDKYISKVIIKTDKETKEITYNNVKLAKAEIKSKEIEKAKVSVEYKIILSNEGKSSVEVNQIKDYVPKGFEFSKNQNSNWTQEGKYRKAKRSV